MPTLEFYGIIVSFSQDYPTRAKDILDTSIYQSYRLVRNYYYVGITKACIVAVLIVMAVMWAILDAWCMIILALAFSFKLKLIVKEANKNYELMVGFAEMQKVGIDYD